MSGSQAEAAKVDGSKGPDLFFQAGNLRKTWPDFSLEASVACHKGEQLALLGPSGSGKSSLLRLIAGLVRPDAGQIWLGGREIGHLPARKRGIGLVFQDFALFPHLDVGDNVAYGLKVRGIRGAELQVRVAGLLERFSLAGYARRQVANLSGGERQRVALARALALEPELMLFDEPLASLDARLRKDLRDELRAIQRRLGLTSVLVTHDQEDALASADRVVVLHQGRVVRSGSPEEVYNDPRTGFVAGFVGDGNILDNQPGWPWHRPDIAVGGPDQPASSAACPRVFLRPEALRPLGLGEGCPDNGSGPTGGRQAELTVVVEDYAYQGRCWIATGRLAPDMAIADASYPERAPRLRFQADSRPRVGETIRLGFDPSALRGLVD